MVSLATLVGALVGCASPAGKLPDAGMNATGVTAADSLANTAAANTTASISGMNSQHRDPAMRPQDDFYQHANGGWLDSTEIPADKSRWGAFDELRDQTLPQLRDIIERPSAGKLKPAGPDSSNLVTDSDQQKITDLYASFMNQSRRDVLARMPLEQEFARIAALQDKQQLPAMIGYFNRTGVTSPYDFGVGQDGRDATRHAVLLVQSGLGLPDRDYYLNDDDIRLKTVRMQYQALIAASLSAIGDKDASINAQQVVALETALAKNQWSKVQNRNPVKSYNPMTMAELQQFAPGFDWQAWQASAGIAGKVDYLIVRQPEFFSGFDRIVEVTPVSVWQAYFRWHVLNRYAAYLGEVDVARHFAFYGTVLRGVLSNEPQWKRGVRLVEGGAGEILGKLYVDKHFPPHYKARMETLVANLLAAYRKSIDTLEWMSLATKQEAQAKLATFKPKIGYPSKWRNYDALVIDRNDLVGNVRRIAIFEHERQVAKLGKPVDRDEWSMTPQTVNAYYSPQKNEIVFPAAILQPPFFNANAEDAVNYGGIGAVIGHEISHGFDDQGSQFDGLGNLRNWWTAEDREKFSVKTRALVAQYSAYSPIPGHQVNGALTLGENIADNAGLAIAAKAYRLSLGGRVSPVIDGMTGVQRLYFGWTQVWRSKVRDAQQIVYLKTDPHAPAQIRSNGTLRNQHEFHDAFQVRQGDQMYLAPQERIIIW